MIRREIIDCIQQELRPQKVMLVYGARRVGKTILIEQIADAYKGKVSIMNGEDQVTQALLRERSAANYSNLFAGTDLLVIDEAQHIADIGQILKLIVDTQKNLSTCRIPQASH